MTRRRSRKAATNPMLAWSNLALKTGEMMLASSQVIGHRTRRMAAAGAIPNARDRKEFILMGQEKIEAATESAQAIAAQMMRANQQLGILAFQQIMGGASAFMALAMSQTLAQSGKRQTEFLRDAVKNSAEVTSHLSGSIARLANHGLKPVHARATGNAKRLLKTK